MDDHVKGRLVFLDFDGVVCDSLPECYTVSLAAYYGLYLKTAAPDELDGVNEAFFRQLRPYIRRGGDYMFIQMAIQQGLALDSQADFDALKSAHQKLDDPFHELFYTARNELFSSDPDCWYSLNPLYPGMKDLLQKHVQDPRYLILSTKEALFIAKILRHHGLDWDEDRIYCSGKERKLAFIDRVMDERGGSSALFVDDQLDHFKGKSRHPVRCLLADWGYVMPDWLESGLADTVSLSGIEAVLDAG
jgi:phosphoglycolate phosphatase-like HAD superfamily hydrolase